MAWSPIRIIAAENKANTLHNFLQESRNVPPQIWLSNPSYCVFRDEEQRRMVLLDRGGRYHSDSPVIEWKSPKFASLNRMHKTFKFKNSKI